ncbi:MAG: hypothetical protein AAGI13_06705 [Pseudomonadota bacterium]
MTTDVFRSVVIPSVEQVPLLEVTQDVETDGLLLQASYEVQQIVLTEFDRRLSNHLAAVRGEGFPTISLTVTITDPATGKHWMPIDQQHFRSLPHALKHIAEFALGSHERCAIKIFARARRLAGSQAFGRPDILTRAKASALTAAIAFCDMLGEVEFLHITGHFSSIVMQPTDQSMGPVVVDLERGAITFPSEVSGPGVVCALFNPTQQIGQDREASGYISQLHHHLALAKEQAIWGFRLAAEERIIGFDKALAGQPLTEYRLTAAETLVTRLRAGLGDSLLGLSEQAQITALGWASLIQRAKERAAMLENNAKPAPQGNEKKQSSPFRLITSE